MGAPDFFIGLRGGGGRLEDFDARESVESWFSQDQRSKKDKLWKIVHKTLSHEMLSLTPLKHLI